MTKAIETLKDSKKARWTALIIVSLAMFGAYFFNYTLSPLKPMLESILGWNSADFGVYTSSYTWFNVFLGMLILSGIILDKMGIRFTGLLATGLMALGTGINYFALIHNFGAGSTFFGVKMQVVVSAIGFGIFGVGTEAAGITVSKAVVKWFKGKEMALAMGMQMSIARLGTALALGVSLPLAKKASFTSPVLLAFVFMLIGFVAFFLYTFMDKKLDASLAKAKEGAPEGAEEEEQFKISDIFSIMKNMGFWYIAILCVLFYGAVFPFLFYATDLMINKYSVNPNLAGTIPALLPFGTIFLTPVFGSIYDKKGKGATIMIIGAVILITVHGVLSIPALDNWIIATAMVILLGIGFSLVPAAMWPSVPKIIPERQLGSAYALIFWIQNIGLWGIPLLLGIVLNSTNPDVSPNKKFVVENLNAGYNVVLADGKVKYDKKEIEKLAAATGNKLIDKVIQTTTYKGVPNSKLDKAKLSAELLTAVTATKPSVQNLKDKAAMEKGLDQATMKAAVPLLKKHKLMLRYDYLYVELIFLFLGFLSLIVGVLLKREDRKRGYGLEQPNINS